ncbi:MAG: thioesterase family protein [Fuerstiella sp.]
MPSEPVFIQHLTVSDDDADRNGHVNNVVYVRWMQDIAVAHYKSQVSHEQTQQLQCLWVARSHYIEYLAQARPGDQLELATWIENWRRVRSTRRYRFRRTSDGAVVAKGETDWVLIDSESHRPKSIPQQIKDQFVLRPDDPE